MCNWKKWIWPGILTTVLLTALALQMKSGLIEQDLQTKAMSGLAQDHQWASVELDGRDLTLSGAAPSEEAISGALQLADSAYDVRVAKSAATPLPIAEPFIFSAVKGDNKLILDGNVPNDQTRKSVTEAAAAAFSGAQVVDNLTLARGAPDGFADLAGFGISQSSGLETGTARITGSELSMEGVARDKASFDAIREALSGTLPGGGKLAMQEIIAPMVSPYTFSATKGDTGVVLEGFVPNEDARAALVSAAAATSSGAVTDNLEPGSGAIEGFGDLAGFATSQLSRFSNGTVSLSNNKLSVKGTALSPQAYDEAVAAPPAHSVGGGSDGL